MRFAAFLMLLAGGSAFAQTPALPSPSFGSVTLSADPTNAAQAARKGYVDSAIAAAVAGTSGSTAGTTTLSARPAAQGLSDTDAFPLGQPSQIGGSVDTLWRGTLSQLWTYTTGKLPAYHTPVVELTGATTLDGPTHNRRLLVITSSLALSLPGAFANLTPSGAFEAELQIENGATLTLPTTGATITAPTTIVGPAQARIRAWTTSGAVNRFSCSSTTPVTVTPTLTFASISSTQPSTAATVVYNFANGAPATFAAAIAGTTVSYASGPTIATASGSGATAVGTVAFGLTTPAAGSYSLTASSTGTYAATAAPYTLVTAASPTLAFTSVSSTTPGATATLVYGFSNGAPTGATLLLDGSAATVASGPTIATTGSGSGATAAGTITWTLTVPAAGTHSLVAAGTGTYASTASAYSWVTAAANLGVTSTFPANLHAFFGNFTSSYAGNQGFSFPVFVEANGAGTGGFATDVNNNGGTELTNITFYGGLSRSATVMPTNQATGSGDPGGDGSFMALMTRQPNGLYAPTAGGVYGTTHPGTYYLWARIIVGGVEYRAVWSGTVTVTAN